MQVCVEFADAGTKTGEVPQRLVTLAAQLGMAALNSAVSSWSENGSTDLDSHLAQAFADVRALSSFSAQTGGLTAERNAFGAGTALHLVPSLDNAPELDHWQQSFAAAGHVPQPSISIGSSNKNDRLCRGGYKHSAFGNLPNPRRHPIAPMF